MLAVVLVETGAILAEHSRFRLWKTLDWSSGEKSGEGSLEVFLEIAHCLNFESGSDMVVQNFEVVLEKNA